MVTHVVKKRFTVMLERVGQTATRPETRARRVAGAVDKVKQGETAR